MIPFYFDGTVWVLGNTTVPAGSLVRSVSGDIVKLYTLERMLLHTAEYSDFTDSQGTPYTTLEAFKTATDDFFVKALATTGALTDVDALNFNTGASSDWELGKLWWDAEEYTLNIGGVNGSILQVGQETFVVVKNQTGTEIPNGSVVYASGTIGSSGKLLVAPYLADNTVDSKYVVGVTTHDIVDGGDGFVTLFGKIRHIDTTGQNSETWTDGTILYASSTLAGGLTSIEPEAPNNNITVAIVIHAAANGTLLVRPTFVNKLTSLQDVDGVVPVSNDVLSFNGTVWNPSTVKAGDVDAGNYLEITREGYVWQYGTKVTFDDESRDLILQPVKNQNAAIVLDYDELVVNFNTNARYPDDYVSIVMQLTHEYAEGEGLYPHLHFIQTADATPNLLLAYRWYNVGEVVPSSYTLVPFTSVSLPYVENLHQIIKLSGLGSIEKADAKISSNLDIKIYRDVTNASGLFAGADTYTGSVLGKYFDIHVPRNTNGSRQQYIK